ncbi:MAG: Nif3-like dinuclear metal center hexameric protein [Ferruginibacter sp.]|nr:Nif3-like dinuclear metal center hexameric protein [Ferruginibacter sp.]
MKIAEVINYLETIAPSSLQETYDNAGLITGSANWECTGAICTLDATEDVVKEAIEKNCNLIVAHHPIIFSGLKKITGKNYVEKTIIAAIKNDIAIYAIHTNLDNVLHGVNAKIADKLGLINRKILSPKAGILKKLYTYIPIEFADKVRDAIFTAGGGAIGNYLECSFVAEGIGSFNATEGTNPWVGIIGERHYKKEKKLEVIFETHKQNQVLNALIKNHPYEEVAYEIIGLDNVNQTVGSGLVGELENEALEEDFLELLKKQFGLKMIKHTPFLGKKAKKIAICGGSGSFLTKAAIAAGAHFYVTADVKYHEFFDAENKLVLADIGHWESEQFTIELLAEVLQQKFPTFAVLKTAVKTNPVQYWS